MTLVGIRACGIGLHQAWKQCTRSYIDNILFVVRPRKRTKLHHSIDASSYILWCSILVMLTPRFGYTTVLMYLRTAIFYLSLNCSRLLSKRLGTRLFPHVLVYCMQATTDWLNQGCKIICKTLPACSEYNCRQLIKLSSHCNAMHIVHSIVDQHLQTNYTCREACNLGSLYCTYKLDWNIDGLKW